MLLLKGRCGNGAAKVVEEARLLAWDWPVQVAFW